MKYFTILVAFFSLSCLGTAEASSDAKFYVHPSQLSISENGIFVRLGEEWFPAEAIHRDAFGIYATGIVDNARIDTSWHCTQGHRNEWWRIHCKECGKRAGEK